MPSVTLPDGARIAYDLYDFTDPWRVAETVVLVHGFSKNRKFWYKWVPALARCYRVVCMDQRGHGESSLPPKDFEMALAPFAADLNEFLDHLEMESAHWVMAEFTSSVAVEFATHYPTRLRTLTLPGFGYTWRGVTPLAWAWAELAEAQGSEAWARATNHLRLAADADPLLREWYITQQAQVPGWLLAKVFRYVPTVDLTEQLPHIQTPTLIIAGGASAQEPIDSVKRGAQLIPNCELVILPGAPFNVMSSRPEESVAATLAFLERHADKAGS